MPHLNIDKLHFTLSLDIIFLTPLPQIPTPQNFTRIASSYTKKSQSNNTKPVQTKSWTNSIRTQKLTKKQVQIKIPLRWTRRVWIGSVLVRTGFGKRGVTNDSLDLLEPVPVAGPRKHPPSSTGTGTYTDPLHLHLVPLLQIVDLVLALLHALVRSDRPLSAAASIANRLRHLLPVPSPEVSSVQLVVLLNVGVQKTCDRCVRPFLPVLPVVDPIRFVSWLGSMSGDVGTGNGFEFLVLVRAGSFDGGRCSGSGSVWVRFVFVLEGGLCLVVDVVLSIAAVVVVRGLVGWVLARVPVNAGVRVKLGGRGGVD